MTQQSKNILVAYETRIGVLTLQRVTDEIERLSREDPPMTAEQIIRYLRTVIRELGEA